MGTQMVAQGIIMALGVIGGPRTRIVKMVTKSDVFGSHPLGLEVLLELFQARSDMGMNSKVPKEIETLSNI